MKKQLLIISFGLVVLALAWAFGGKEKNPAALDAFAACLRDKNIVMYGADWCPHCQNEKAAFGDSFRFVPYVECPDEPQKCISVGINGYPTWIFPDGRRFEGEQGLENLSRESGCNLN